MLKQTLAICGFVATVVGWAVLATPASAQLTTRMTGFVYTVRPSATVNAQALLEVLVGRTWIGLAGSKVDLYRTVELEGSVIRGSLIGTVNTDNRGYATFRLQAPTIRNRRLVYEAVFAGNRLGFARQVYIIIVTPP